MVLLRCYAKITDWIYELFNQATWADFRFLPIYSYGFWVAVGFFAAATLATIELRRREKLSLLKGEEKDITVGDPPSISDTVIYFIFGFIVFYKLIGIFAYLPELRAEKTDFTFFTYLIADQSGGLLSKVISFFTYGSIIGGILGGGAMAGWYYYTKKKELLPKPETKKITINPSDNMGDLVVIAAILGVLGSILFNFLETDNSISSIIADPVGFLTSGLSVYGGLICAGLGFAAYAYKKKYHFGHFFDSIAPGFMLANGFGRIGCQMSGDGDWGITNTSPTPSWLPEWLWKSYYEHNIVNEGIYMEGCAEEHCMRLLLPAYPTPIYEFLMCTAIFFILWALRKKLTAMPGVLFGIFMMLIGIQRYSIEQIRTVSGRDEAFLGIPHLLQSEGISIILFLIGVGMTVYLYRRYKQAKTA